MIVHLVAGLRSEYQPIVEANHFSVDRPASIGEISLLLNTLELIAQHLDTKDRTTGLMEMRDVDADPGNSGTDINGCFLLRQFRASFSLEERTLNPVCKLKLDSFKFKGF